eukprot:c19796_g1_i2.p1 GENE.c19796_g1_i2~~c19796_g1_i2.p1  ORF type:complete len:323 (-),score=143.97 c19796_g1_i2:229-1197(-)
MFNLASFVPSSEDTEKWDILQPVCGYGVSGRIIGILGSHKTDLSNFVDVLTPSDAIRTNEKFPTRVQEILDFGQHVTNKFELVRNELHGCLNRAVGVLFHRQGFDAQTKTKVTRSVLILDNVQQKLDPNHWLMLLAFVKRITPSTRLTVFVNMTGSAERRVLFPFLDDCLIFDDNGIGYFGPANRLKEYLTLVGFSVPPNVHPTDHLINLMSDYSISDIPRAITDTSPLVRYRYSPLAAHVSRIVEAICPPQQATESPPQSLSQKKSRKSFFGKKPKKEEQSEQDNNEEKKVTITDEEAERRRIAESQAESVWTRMSDNGDT